MIGQQMAIDINKIFCIEKQEIKTSFFDEKKKWRPLDANLSARQLLNYKTKQNKT